ncbi:MAG: PIN domain-containing protein, partial [Planctomycetes bacterium]|nr:PIN domain-containing protein [Planctomycetota bacterium]
MIMLDTNFLFAMEKPGHDADQRLRRWLARGEQIGVSAIVWTEYLCGPLPPAKIALADAIVQRKEPLLVTDA